LNRLRNFFLLVVILASSLLSWNAQAEDLQQTDPAVLQAQSLIKTLIPEEKIGQLFLITFKGTDVSSMSQIYDLITNYHIGGVVLSSANDNFAPAGRTPEGVHQLIGQMQSIEGDAAIRFATVPNTGTTYQPAYIPLFVGLSQEGDGYPTDQIFNGATMLPDEMALGATWKPDLATQVGVIMGSELQDLGFNLYFGPSLDVLDTTHTESSKNLGTRSFGGNAYWVGEMGRAFITGLHQGGDNRLAVISKFFPGSGSADRLPDDEVSTVRKTIDDLKKNELVPFAAVTGNAQSVESTTDGLLVTHIRYQGFQGNISPSIKPVSSDPAAMSSLLALPQFATWRQKGGLMVSDDLGSRALRLFYDPSGKSFNASNVALNAFLAGNDLLYADNFVSNGDADSYTTIKNTLDFFVKKYKADAVFQQQVDASLVRIITLKLRLYNSPFSLKNVVSSDSNLTNLQLDKSKLVVSDVARQSVTVISPSATELDNVLPKAPDARDRIVFLTDVQTGKQCNQCQDQTPLTVDALQNSVLKFYGPSQSRQVNSDRLTSYSLADVDNFLNKVKAPANIETDLQNATWVVFAILNPIADKPETLAYKHLLSARPDLLNNKKVIIFAFGAPYNLDATDISKITAYYGLYSKAPQFIDVAAKVLFHEIVPAGALPVSVPGVGYDIGAAVSADPSQVIPLAFDIPEKPRVVGTSTPQPTPVPTYKIGDSIPLKAGPIYDQNHNLVPNQTVVQFVFQTGGETGPVQQVESETQVGIAHATYRIEKPGSLVIKAASEKATKSDVLGLNVTDTGSTLVIFPTQALSITPTPTSTTTPTLTLTPTTAPTPILPRPGRPFLSEWALSILLIAMAAGLAYGLGFWLWGSLRWGMRWSLCAVLGGLAGYLYLAAGMPGGTVWIQGAGTNGILMGTLMGILSGWIAAIIWHYTPMLSRDHR
jgi:beta-N-acetylhexosaminidase